VLGQVFESVPLEEAVSGDAYILTTPDPEQDRIGTGFQATRDNTRLELMLENPIGTVHWRTDLSQGWRAGDNQLFSKLERHAPGVPNLVIHYDVDGEAALFGSVTDNTSGDPTTREVAIPGTHLVMPVIGRTPGSGVDWYSQFLAANLAQQPNEVELFFYPRGGNQALIAGLSLDPGEVVGYDNLLGQVTWRDAQGNPVVLDQDVGGLEIVADHDVIAAGRFYSVDRTNGTVMGQSMRAFATPNLLPDTEYLFLGVRNEDATGVVRARLGFTNLTEEEATVSVDVLRQDGTLAGSFDRAAGPKRFTDWPIPKSITEEDEIYTLVVTTTQPGYAYLSQINRSNDPSTNYPLERR